MVTLSLENQGESITFLNAFDPAAAVAEIEITMAPGAKGPPAHRHTRQSETFSIVSGSLLVYVDGREHVLRAGDSLVVEPGQVHTFANGSPDEPVISLVRVEPALHFQWFLSEMARSAIRNGGDWQSLPLLEAAHILHLVRDEYEVANLPRAVQRSLFGMLAGTARLLGRTRHITPIADAVRPTATT